jgi:hypothetical protein
VSSVEKRGPSYEIREAHKSKYTLTFLKAL